MPRLASRTRIRVLGRRPATLMPIQIKSGNERSTIQRVFSTMPASMLASKLAQIEFARLLLAPSLSASASNAHTKSFGRCNRCARQTPIPVLGHQQSGG